MNRRKFSKQAALGTLSFAAFGLGCKTTTPAASTNVTKAMPPFFKLSLAQWSLHKAHFEGGLDPFDFAKKSKELGFAGLEYVNHIYKDSYQDADNQLNAFKKLAGKLKMQSMAHGMENLLVMIDGEGDLAIQDEVKRLEGVTNHQKWIDLANEIGCHSIRINLFGDGEKEAQENAAADSMMRLGDYAKDMNINILVENHGGLSSDPQWTTNVMKKANRSNVGTLPDFGNFCIEKEGGVRWGAPCINEYPDIYKAVKMMMPYAKAVSAKSYAFDDSGHETKIDYYKMLEIVKKAGYTGYIGVEFEGEEPEEIGISKTRDLLLKVASSLS